MPRYDRNSEWEKRTQDLRTNHGLVGDALEKPKAFEKLMQHYRSPVTSYLKCFLLRHKLASDEKAIASSAAKAAAVAAAEKAAEEAAAVIWEELKRALPDRLASEWGEGKKSFRELLREGVHSACHSWAKPATHGLIVAGPDDDKAWHEEMRRALLGKALEKLKAYQREHTKKGNLYFTIFRLWDEHRDDSLDELNARLAALPGGRRLAPPAFRKALGRARDQFGEYLFEEIAAWIAQRDMPSPEKYIQVFEEMDLMDDYALKSKPCRWLLGLEDEDDEEE